LYFLGQRKKALENDSTNSIEYADRSHISFTADEFSASATDADESLVPHRCTTGH